MDNATTFTKRLSRRSLLRIVAVAGAAAGCWQLGLFGNSKPLKAAHRSLPIMGTQLNLTVYGPDRDSCEAALSATIDTMRGLEAKLSRHDPRSDLSRLNQTGRLDTPDGDLVEVLTLAQEVSRRSGGASGRPASPPCPGS